MAHKRSGVTVRKWDLLSFACTVRKICTKNIGTVLSFVLKYYFKASTYEKLKIVQLGAKSLKKFKYAKFVSSVGTGRDEGK